MMIAFAAMALSAWTQGVEDWTRAEERRAEPYAKVLENDPDNPEANQAVGVLLAFVKQDWKAAMPLLAKAKDAKIVLAAKRDSSHDPKSHEEAAGCGDAWASVAKALSGTKQRNVMARAAGFWGAAVALKPPKDPLKALTAKFDAYYRALGRVTVQVSAREKWVDSGIHLVPGASVRVVSSTGQWCINDNPDKSQWTDWRGFPKWLEANNPLPTANLMCLIAKVGDDGAAYAPYKDNPRLADACGRLWLGANDVSPQNSVGEVSAVLEVSLR